VNSGDPADDPDVWLRAVTNSNHIRRGRVHHAEFKKWLAPPDDPKAGWKLEISGQLLSLVDNICNQAEERVEGQRKKLRAAGKAVPSCLIFCGVLYAKVDAIRKIRVLKCDVICDPQPEDGAHANVVVLDKGPDEILTVTDTLLETLAWVLAAQIGNDPKLSSAKSR
jgi:hypothetical protein